MAVSGADPYEGREQTFVKHEVLRRYLQRLAFKVGNFQPGTTLNYIDGFSGPWDAVRDDHGEARVTRCVASGDRGARWSRKRL